MSDGWTESVWRSRKDTRTWCKGKVGTPHKLVIEADPRQGWGREGCYWTSTYFVRAGDRKHYLSWHCRHIERCTNCQKILRMFLDVKDECPEYRPEPPEEVMVCRWCHLPASDHDENGYGTGGRRGFHSYWFSERERS